MFSSLAFMVLLTYGAVEAAPPSSARGAAVVLGDFQMTGDAVTAASRRTPENGEGAIDFQCSLQGNARLTFGDDAELAVTAESMNVVMNGADPLRIVCSGRCELVDAETRCQGDRMEIAIGRNLELVVTGHAQLVLSRSQGATTLACDSLEFRGDGWSIKGGATLLQSDRPTEAAAPSPAP